MTSAVVAPKRKIKKLQRTQSVNTAANEQLGAVSPANNGIEQAAPTPTAVPDAGTKQFAVLKKPKRLKPLSRARLAKPQAKDGPNANGELTGLNGKALVENKSNGSGDSLDSSNGRPLSQLKRATNAGNGTGAAPLRRLGKLRSVRSTPSLEQPATTGSNTAAAVTVRVPANGSSNSPELSDANSNSHANNGSAGRRPIRKLRPTGQAVQAKPAPTERQQVIGGSASRGLYSNGQGQIDDIAVADLNIATDFSDLSGLLEPPRPVERSVEAERTQSEVPGRPDTETVAQSNTITAHEKPVIQMPGPPSSMEDVTLVPGGTLEVEGHGVEFDHDDGDVKLVAPAEAAATTSSSDAVTTTEAGASTSAPASIIPPQAVPPVQIPATTGSVPVMHVPVPQFVPISDAGVPQVNMTGQAAVEEDSNDRQSRPEIAAKLPDPSDTGAEVTVSGQTQEDETAEKKQPPSADELNAKNRQARAAEAYRSFQQQLEQAQADIRKKQEPFTGKAPRLLNKHIANLENLRSQEADEIVKLLRLISRSESAAAISTFREYSERRQDAVRLACAEGLSRIDDISASLALLQLLPDGVADVVDAAVRGLLTLGHEESLSPVLALALVHPRLRAMVREEIAGADDPASFEEPLLKIVKKKTPVPDQAAFALSLVARISGAEQLKLYNQYTRHPAPAMRVSAIEALALVGEKKGVGIFNKALSDKDATVRAAAATALATLHSPKSIALLTKALKDSEAVVRRSTSKTLASLESKEVAGAAASALKKESDPVVVEHLLEIIAKGGGDGALGTLQKYIQGEDLEMRHRAISTLRKLKNPKGAKLLMPLLEDSDRDTRRLSVEALGQIGHKGAAGKLRELLIKDPIEHVRAACARALGDLKDESSIAKLEEALDDGRIVQCQAIIGLGTIGSEKAQPALLAQLRNSAPEVRYHACNSLAQIGSLSNTQPIEKLLEDKDAMVRRGAENALEKLGVSAGSKVVRSVKRTLSGVGSALIPSSLASGIPGGTKGLLTVTAVAMLAVGAFAARGLVTGLGGKSSSNIPVTRVKQVCLSPNGKHVYIARSNSCDIWDLEKGELLERFQSGFLNGALFSSSGEEALIFSKKGPATYSMKDGFTPELEANAEALGQPTSTYYPGDGKSIIVAVKDGSASKLVEYNLDSLEKGKVKPVSTLVTGRFAVSPALDTMVVVNGDKADLFLGEQLKKAPITLQLSKLLPSAKGEIADVCFNHDGSLLALASRELVLVVEIASAEVKAVLFKKEVGAAQIARISFTDRANTLVAVTNGCMTITAGDNFSKVDVKKSPTSGGMSVFDLSPDLSLAAYAEDASKDLFFVDLKQSKVVHMLKGKRQ